MRDRANALTLCLLRWNRTLQSVGNGAWAGTIRGDGLGSLDWLRHGRHRQGNASCLATPRAWWTTDASFICK
jgi:hypothetical protein